MPRQKIAEDHILWRDRIVKVRFHASHTKKIAFYYLPKCACTTINAIIAKFEISVGNRVSGECSLKDVNGYQRLQQQLGKQFGAKGANIEDMLKSAMKDNLPEGEANMINSLLSNPMVKSISDKLLSEDNLNKMKDIFMDFIGSEEVADEINNIKQIFNEDKVMKVLSELFEKVQSLEDISNIQSMVEGNQDIQDIVNKFENAMKSGLINEQKLANLAQKAADKFMSEFKNMGILDGKNMGMLKSLMGQFGGDILGIESKSEKKLTKQERRAKAQKKYRRNKRTELKKKKRGRNNRKK